MDGRISDTNGHFKIYVVHHGVVQVLVGVARVLAVVARSRMPLCV